MEHILYLWVETQYYKDVSYLKLTCRFNVIPNRILIRFWGERVIELLALVLNVYGNSKGHAVKALLRMKNIVGELVLLDTKIYHKTVIIMIVSFRYNDPQISSNQL